jgi:GNAT superfamily N-acetyltransferase
MINLQLIDTAIAGDLLHALVYNIWPEPYAQDAYLVTVEDGKRKPTGNVFAIRYVRPGVGLRNVGITGYFDIDNDKGIAYLRWTGLLPEYRGRGIFREALRQLVLQLKGANPSISALVELVPDNEYGHSIVVPAFERVGFKRNDSIRIPAGEDADWPCIPYVLNI